MDKKSIGFEVSVKVTMISEKDVPPTSPHHRGCTSKLPVNSNLRSPSS